MSLLQFRDSCKRLGGMGRPADLGGNIIAVVGEKTRMIMSFMIDLPWAGGGSGGEGGGERCTSRKWEESFGTGLRCFA